jgi:N-acetylneuraminate synthase/N,N'-diacetyllegionaminate synthase
MGFSLSIGWVSVDPAAMAPTFVIAEAGVNHNGRPDLAHRLVDEAVAAGANAVKFQTFDADKVVSATGRTADYQRSAAGADSQRVMLRELELPYSSWQELAAHCSERGIEFMSTAFDWDSLELLLTIGLQRIKVPSGEIDNLPFLRRVADLALPLIISTGMSTWEEVDEAIGATRRASDVTLLHCVSRYPAPSDVANLSVIPVMRERYGRPVGWSDHTVGLRSAVVAVALGATVIEKHLTLDKSMPGPDHAASADPLEFQAYVAAIRETELMLGTPEKRRVGGEDEVALVARRSHHASRDLEAGAVLSAEDTELLRPAIGVPASASLVGRRVRLRIRAGEAVEERHLVGHPDEPPDPAPENAAGQSAR